MRARVSARAHARTRFVAETDDKRKLPVEKKKVGGEILRTERRPLGPRIVPLERHVKPRRDRGQRVFVGVRRARRTWSYKLCTRL